MLELVTSETKAGHFLLKKGQGTVSVQVEHCELAKLFENESAVFIVTRKCDGGAGDGRPGQLTQVPTKSLQMLHGSGREQEGPGDIVPKFS